MLTMLVVKPPKVFVGRSIANSAHLNRRGIQICGVRKFSEDLVVNLKQRHPDHGQQPSITLFQYAICPFCNIVKAVLDYSSLKYDHVEVNPLTKAEIKWSKDYRKVPIAKMNEKQINGSEEIVRAILSNENVAVSLERRWGNSTSVSEFVGSASSKKWFHFAVEELAPLLYPNICPTLSDSYRAFDYVDGVAEFSPMQRVLIRNVGALAMYFAASKIKKKRGIDCERQALREALALLERDGLSDGNGEAQFLSASPHPHLGDLAVFGTLRSIEKLMAHERIFAEDANGSITKWYSKMKKELSR